VNTKEFFYKSLQLAIISAPLRVIWSRSAGNVSSRYFFKPRVIVGVLLKRFVTVMCGNVKWSVQQNKVEILMLLYCFKK